MTATAKQHPYTHRDSLGSGYFMRNSRSKSSSDRMKPQKRQDTHRTSTVLRLRMRKVRSRSCKGGGERKSEGDQGKG
jgi:hypothetical protein